MAISVDWGTKIIFIPKAYTLLIQATPTEIRELDLNVFRLDLKDLEDSEDGMPMLDTHQHNPPVDVGGITLARVVEIINGYTITFEDGQYAVNLKGANSNFGDRVNVNQVSVRSSNSAGLVTSAGIEAIEYGGRVTVDFVNGEPGSIYPIGTLRRPVNNWTDALLILGVKGFNEIFLLSDAVVPAGIGLEFITMTGRSMVDTHLEVQDAAVVGSVSIENVNLTGTLDGGVYVRHCLVSDLSYVNGQIENSGMYGTIVLAGDEEATLLNCYGVDPDSPLIVDMGGSGQDLSMPNFSGIVTVMNLSSASEEIGIGLNAGMVIIDSSITAGTILVAGVGMCNDFSTGSAIVNTDGLLNKELIVAAMKETFEGKVYINVVAGEVGTTSPIGIESRPSNNIADAITIATREGISTMHIVGALELTGGVDVSGYTFTSSRSVGNSLVMTSCITAGTYVDNLTAMGTMNGRGRLTYCAIPYLNHFDGGIKNSLLLGKIQFSGTSVCYLTDTDTFITSHGDSIELDIGDSVVNVIKAAGNYTISNKTGDSLLNIGMRYGDLTIADTCVAGYIHAGGLGSAVDNSADTCSFCHNEMLNESGITDAVWNEMTSGHTLAGTTGAALVSSSEDVSFIKSIEGGRWKIVGSQMIFYEDDNTTVVATFDLFQANGTTPATKPEDMYERRRV